MMSDITFPTKSYSFYQRDKDQNNNSCEIDSVAREISWWERNIEIEKVTFGITAYPLQRRIVGYFGPSNTTNSNTTKPYVFVVPIFDPPLQGTGNTMNEAQKNWEYRFHATFQKLYVKEDFEFTEDEAKHWKIFEETVDIPAYKNKNPLSTREIGKMISNVDIPVWQREIEWIDGLKEIVDCEVCPREFTNFATDQYFEANVMRKYQTEEIIEILTVTPINYKEHTEQEIDDFVNSLPSSKDLPNFKIWK